MGTDAEVGMAPGNIGAGTGGTDRTGVADAAGVRMPARGKFTGKASTLTGIDACGVGVRGAAAGWVTPGVGTAARAATGVRVAAGVRCAAAAYRGVGTAGVPIGASTDASEDGAGAGATVDAAAADIPASTGCAGGAPETELDTVTRAGVARDTPPPKAGPPELLPNGVTDTGSVPPAIAITPPHTEQRARTPVAGTLAGSTRNTDRHSGHETVMTHLPPNAGLPVPLRALRRLPRPFPAHPVGGPRPTRSRATSLHNSSFPSPTR